MFYQMTQVSEKERTQTRSADATEKSLGAKSVEDFRLVKKTEFGFKFDALEILRKTMGSTVRKPSRDGQKCAVPADATKG